MKEINYKLFFGMMLVFEIASYIGWKFPEWNGLVFLVLVFVSMCIVVRNIHFGILLMCINLIIDPFGRMVSYGFVSYRMALFFILILSQIFSLATKAETRQRLKKFGKTAYGKTLYVLLLWITFLSMVSFVVGNQMLAIVSSANGFWFLLLIPLCAIVNIHTIKNFYETITSSLVWLFFKSIILFTYMNHMPRPFFDSEIYRFIRDTRVAEMTPLTDSGVRIFMQSHLYPALFFVVLVIVGHQKNKLYTAGLWGTMMILLLSLSRSFWIGIGFSITYFLVNCLRLRVWSKFWQSTRSIIFSLMGSIIVLFTLFAFPFASYHYATPFTSFADMFVGRAQLKSEYAALSRFEMLPELFSYISLNPIVGSGFGGIYMIANTQKIMFEWGWFDMWLTMGAIGVSLYGMFLFFFTDEMSSKLENPLEKTAVRISIFALIIIHFFTPYINHPLGIGWLVMIMIFCESRNRLIRA